MFNTPGEFCILLYIVSRPIVFKYVGWYFLCFQDAFNYFLFLFLLFCFVFLDSMHFEFIKMCLDSVHLVSDAPKYSNDCLHVSVISFSQHFPLLPIFWTCLWMWYLWHLYKYPPPFLQDRILQCGFSTLSPVFAKQVSMSRVIISMPLPQVFGTSNTATALSISVFSSPVLNSAW